MHLKMAVQASMTDQQQPNACATQASPCISYPPGPPPYFSDQNSVSPFFTSAVQPTMQSLPYVLQNPGLQLSTHTNMPMYRTGESYFLVQPHASVTSPTGTVPAINDGTWNPPEKMPKFS